MIIWRLTTKESVEEAFNGEGASRYGGRWNSQGTKLVYCSESVSLSVLENLVHFDVDLAPPLYLYEVTVEDYEIHRDLHIYNLLNNESESKSYGDQWVSSVNKTVLEVPSVIIPREKNYLINPNHSNFSQLKITQHGLFDLDSRLTK